MSILRQSNTGGVSLYNTKHPHTHTHLSTIHLHLHAPLHVDTLIFVLPLNPFHFQPAIQMTSPQFSYSCCCTSFILLSDSHFCFTVLRKIFFDLSIKLVYNISIECAQRRVRLCARDWSRALSAPVLKWSRISNCTAITTKVSYSRRGRTSALTCRALHDLSSSSHNPHEFLKIILRKKGVFWFSAQICPWIFPF